MAESMDETEKVFDLTKVSIHLYSLYPTPNDENMRIQIVYWKFYNLKGKVCRYKI